MDILLVLLTGIGVIAGAINFSQGILHRQNAAVLAIRFAAGIVSLATAVSVWVFHIDSFLSLQNFALTNLLYIFIIIGVFIGVTLMLPASVERSMQPAQEQSKTTHITSKLSGSPKKVGEDWVN